MLQNLTCLLTLIIGVVGYHQTDYVIEQERMELSSFNNKFVHAEIRNFKFNRTALAANVTYYLKNDFGNNLRVNIQAYKFASNEYRLFPMTFSINLCETLMGNEFGMQNIYECGKAARCPLVKGHYFFCNWTPDYSKFPPYVPIGKYRLDLTFVYGSEELAHVQYFATFKSAKWGNW